MGAGEIARFGHDLAILDNRIEIINYMLGYGIKNAIGNPMMMCISRGEYRIMVGTCEMDSFGIYDYVGAEMALKRLDGLNDGLWYMLGKWLRPINTT